MARINAANFSGGLQFPYANASTDLFKKEDLQVLAQAVDQHDHTSGKGLVLSAGAIPNGLITSAMIADGTITSADIADGTIVTADLALNAVTQLGAAFTAPSPVTTTSATLVDLPDMTFTGTFSGGAVVAWLTATMTNSVAGNGCYMALRLDASDGTPMLLNAPVAGGGGVLTVMGLWTLSGSHTIKGRYAAPNGGTTTALATNRQLTIVEFLR